MQLPPRRRPTVADAFQKFRTDPVSQFLVKLRRKRAEQIRRLLSAPDSVDVATFNKEVWVICSRVVLDGEEVKLLDRGGQLVDPSRAVELGEALDSGRLEYHGNSMWGSATKVYYPTQRSAEQKEKNLQRALTILNDASLSPIEKVWKLVEIPGFKWNSSTGLVMAFHPSEFAIWNSVSQPAVTKLGYRCDNDDLSEFQDAVSDLRLKLGATDFIELDCFLYAISVDILEATRWDEFVSWAKRLFQQPNFDDIERNYKLRIASELRKAKEAILSADSTWPKTLKAAFASRDNNLSNWRSHDPFLQSCERDPGLAASALRELWDESAPLQNRLTEFAEKVSTLFHASDPVAMASFLLMANDPAAYPFYRKTPFRTCFDLTGEFGTDSGASAGVVYEHALRFLDLFVVEAKARGLDLRDRLDAQSLVWSIAKYKRHMLPEDWTEADKDAFLKYRGDEVEDDATSPENGESEATEKPAVGEPPKGGLAELAEELFLDLDYLTKIRKLLGHKGQAIFYGPPGTGKTYVAKKLADFLAGEGGRVDIVQFHPSYAYEDFVEGYRPHKDGGFRLEDGPLKQIAQLARKNEGEPHILLIDEINRGNIAKVFGELYFLLEYRDEEIQLQYSAEAFSLPKNLWIIGTMNSADRSIALIDGALRRRFYFVPFFPHEAPVKGLLRRWLIRNKPELLWVDDVVEQANQLLDIRHSSIGPSHFMRHDLDEHWVALIWEHSVLPYIEELLLGEGDRISEFSLEKLRAADGRQPGEE